MSFSRLLTPFALCLALLACGAQAPAASAPSAQTQQVQPDPATPLAQAAPRARAAEIPGLTLGQDYDIIEGGQRFTQGDHLEIAEVFAYWCGGCAHFAPLVDGWKPRLPAGAALVYIPLVGQAQDQYPRAFYAAEAAGITDKVHSAIFRAIHVERSLRPNASADDIAAFLARQSGTSAQDIKSTMESFAVNANLGRARQFAIRNGVSHTPMLIIDGQYRVNGKNQEDQLRIADRIIAHLSAKAA